MTSRPFGFAVRIWAATPKLLAKHTACYGRDEGNSTSRRDPVSASSSMEQYGARKAQFHEFGNSDFRSVAQHLVNVKPSQDGLPTPL